MCFTSCNVYKTTTVEANNHNKKDIWVKAFKQRVFYECLKGSFENKELFELIRMEDFFDTTDYLSFPSIDKARVISKSFIKTIPKWVSHCDDCKEEQYKKPIFSYCLNYYVSPKLDSIAKMEYIKMKKG